MEGVISYVLQTNLWLDQGYTPLPKYEGFRLSWSLRVALTKTVPTSFWIHRQDRSSVGRSGFWWYTTLPGLVVPSPEPIIGRDWRDTERYSRWMWDIHALSRSGPDFFGAPASSTTWQGSEYGKLALVTFLLPVPWSGKRVAGRIVSSTFAIQCDDSWTLELTGSWSRVECPHSLPKPDLGLKRRPA